MLLPLSLGVYGILVIASSCADAGHFDFTERDLDSRSETEGRQCGWCEDRATLWQPSLQNLVILQAKLCQFIPWLEKTR